MECQKIIDLLSAYIDGELESSQAALVSEHLEHCWACREEWQALLDINSLLQELPEVTPPPEFYAGLQARLAELPIAATTETVKRQVSPWQKLARGPWSKVVASAAVVMLVFGITALWYPDSLGLKAKPAGERFEAFPDSISNNLSGIKEDRLAQKQINVAATPSEKEEPGAEQFDIKNLDSSHQNDSLQINNTRNENVETKKRVDNNQLEASVPVKNIPKQSDAAMEQDRIKAFAAMPKLANRNNEAPVHADGFAEQSLQKSMSIQLKVADVINATSEILILSEINAATALVQQNNISITVPAENYEIMLEQLENLGQVVNKEPWVKDISLKYQKLSGQFYTIQLELQ